MSLVQSCRKIIIGELNFEACLRRQTDPRCLPSIVCNWLEIIPVPIYTIIRVREVIAGCPTNALRLCGNVFVSAQANITCTNRPLKALGYTCEGPSYGFGASHRQHRGQIPCIHKRPDESHKVGERRPAMELPKLLSKLLVLFGVFLIVVLQFVPIRMRTVNTMSEAMISRSRSSPTSVTCPGKNVLVDTLEHVIHKCPA